MNCFPFLFLFVIGVLSVTLTPQQNKILKANCGRYVRGFTSLDSPHRDDTEHFKALYGRKVTIGEAPWAVSLAVKKKKKDNVNEETGPEEYTQHGTGTLISPWHIVSAAHLIGISEDPKPDCETGDMKDAHFLHNFKDFAAFINVTCATPVTCERMSKQEMFEPIPIKALYIRRGYVGDGCIDKESYNDIAVFEMERPVNFSRNIFPVCLPTSSESPVMGEKGYRLYGFGRDLSDKTMESGILKTLNSFVTECSDEFMHGGIFCTSAENRGLSCDGDSGSGVIRTSRSREVNEIAGVLSAGMPCGELYETHKQQYSHNRKLTRETDLLIDVAHHLEFFCKCCGMC